MSNEELKSKNKLPNGWSYAGLEDISDIDKHSIKRGPFGSALKKAFFVPEGYKVYEQGNVINSDFDRGIYFINDERFEDLKSFSIKPRDILMSCAGTVGKLAIVPEGIQEGVINQALLKLSVHNDIDLQYFFKLFSYQIDEILKDNLRGSAMMNLTSVKDLKLVRFPIAPYNEQKRIVIKIEKLFSNLDNNDKYLGHLEKQLKRYRQSVLKSAFEGELTKEWREKQTNIENADELLEKIKIERIEYIENEVREKFKDKTEKWIIDKIQKEVEKFLKSLKPIDKNKINIIVADGWGQNILSNLIVINPNYSLVKGKISKFVPMDSVEINSKNYSYFEERVWSGSGSKFMNNDVLFARITPSTQNGKISIANKLDSDEIAGGSTELIVLKHSRHINKNILYYYLKFEPVKTFLVHRMAGVTGRQRVPNDAFDEIILPICSTEEQQEIVKQIEKHFSIIDKLEDTVQKSIKESKRLKQSILKQAFEGKLVEQDENDESAEILLEKIAKAKEEYKLAQKEQKKRKK